jgi:hypothetical protein
MFTAIDAVLDALEGIGIDLAPRRLYKGPRLQLDAERSARR